MAVALILMMLPICLDVIAMRVFGHQRGGESYRAFITLTVLFWVLPALYLFGI